MAIYLVGCTDNVNVSARLNTPAEAERMKAQMAPIQMIEVGWFSYWLMKRNLPRLAMAPFWK